MKPAFQEVKAASLLYISEIFYCLQDQSRRLLVTNLLVCVCNGSGGWRGGRVGQSPEVLSVCSL